MRVSSSTCLSFEAGSCSVVGIKLSRWAGLNLSTV